MTKITLRDFLSNKELIGFVPGKSGGQPMRRASSAKITEPLDPAEFTTCALRNPKSDKPA
jgi:hypothetical protein